ncbi:hypothetical protein [Reinekea sp.]|jgi:hypothetical protein|uniref:hypothetical protein n=1 Tax=Reinekea sp. TaxID=1970455 RepID=UPI002A802B57|nr:hypothetical protein [Reinekea sp.]
MSRSAERGVALIAAIFLVVIIGAGLVLLSVLSVRNSQQTTQNLLQIRGQLSVDAVLEFAVQSLVEGVTCATLNSTYADSIAIEGYPGFDTTLTCVQNDYSGAQTISILTLEATSEKGDADDADYVWARSEAAIELES